MKAKRSDDEGKAGREKQREEKRRQKGGIQSEGGAQRGEQKRILMTKRIEVDVKKEAEITKHVTNDEGGLRDRN